MHARIGVARDAAVHLLLDANLDKRFIAKNLGMHANNIKQCSARAVADDDDAEGWRNRRSTSWATSEPKARASDVADFRITL